MNNNLLEKPVLKRKILVLSSLEPGLTGFLGFETDYEKLFIKGYLFFFDGHLDKWKKISYICIWKFKEG